MTIHLSIHKDLAVLSIRGRFDFSVHGVFRKLSEEALAQAEVKRVEVNLEHVDYLDSSALGMLLLLREKAASAGKKEVGLMGVRGVVLQVLEVANFGRLFPINRLDAAGSRLS